MNNIHPSILFYPSFSGLQGEGGGGMSSYAQLWDILIKNVQLWK